MSGGFEPFEEIVLKDSPKRVPLISGRRVRTAPKVREMCWLRGEDRRLPEALTCCHGCGRRISKPQLKWAVVERLVQNQKLSQGKRLEVMRLLFPEDTRDRHAPRKRD